MKRADHSGYSIPVKGLPAGTHHFSFEIDGEFFGRYENSEVVGARLSAEVNVVKSSTLMNISGAIAGVVSVECDRCLDELELPIETEFSLIVKLTKDVDEEDDEIMMMDQSEGEMDLSQLLYDTVILSLPLQRVHDEGNCNPEMIEKLRSLSGSGGEESEDEDTVSPFSVLKKLKN